ncbi:EcsC family protein [Sphingomonas sanxanigenens]|uniref:Protein EcsC n=1 Tax=Sphingomonas sanxanigenens DSM 19645 = NX02 TaxID=1123269 RepID=W0AHV9_9SPHN|nr:EcsC family protein [Sphingomonas sanxanigenens]AHE56122.1 hypothetical protein NX02_22515 [Sphingomonas sanxanigenens DSM 19645 = NX02]
MTTQEADDLGNACGGFDAPTLDAIRSAADRYVEAHGLFMQIVGWAGQAAEGLVSRLPDEWRDRIESVGLAALDQAYAAAAATQPGSEEKGLRGRALGWTKGETWHRVATGVTGALGGLGGLATTLVDLPVTTTLILRSVQQVAASYGEDPALDETRAQSIAVFALGGPLPEDGTLETGLFAARLALTGKAVAEMLKAALPRFGAVVSQKALAQATPLLGAAAGAIVNPVFASYYQAMAHVHFGLRRIERTEDAAQVRACFERLVAAARADRSKTVTEAARRRVPRLARRDPY